MELTERPWRNGAGDEVRMLDLAAVVLRRWRLVAGVTLAVLVLAAAAAVLRPKRYTATTVVLPPPAPQVPGRAQMLASALGIQGIGLEAGSGVQTVSAIAKSRSVADSVVARVGGPRPDEATESALRKMVAKHTRVTLNDNGSITVEVTGPDARLAARAANAFPPLINAFAAELSTQAAQRKEEFLAAQIGRARDQLIAAQDALVRFQTGTHTPEPAEQARVTLNAAALLQQRIGEQEIVVQQLARTSTPDNPQLRAAQAELQARRDQLSRLTAQGGPGGMFVPLGSSAGIKATSMRLAADYARAEQIYTSLTAAYAQAQVDANNNLPVISVLDPARVPERPAGPGLKVILAIALVLGLVLGLIAAFVAEHLRRARTDPASQGFFVAWDQFRGAFPGRGSPRRAPRAGAAAD